MAARPISSELPDGKKMHLMRGHLLFTAIYRGRSQRATSVWREPSCTEHFAWNTLKQNRLRMEEVGVIMEQEDASLVRLVGTITIGNWPK